MSADDDKNAPGARPSRVRTDERGHTVWDETIKTAKLELVSTDRLKQLIDEGNPEARDRIRELASAGSDGYLAEDGESGTLSIIGDDDLQALLDSRDDNRPSLSLPDPVEEPASGDDEELSLVSTRRLRKLFDVENDAPQEPAKPGPATDEGGGFDPYNTG